ncbi:MAG TPA: hypothetical protein VFT79_11010 [Solirubrobacterales bacterium]|nr:hypothetical protein [Solirubrobacterales bacterium]
MSVPWKAVAAGTIVVALVLGLLGVGDALNPLVAAAVVAVVVLLMWPSSWPRLDLFVLRALGATLVAALVLAGVNVFTNAIGIDRLPILLGLILAVVVFGLAAFWYLNRCEVSTRLAIIGAAVLAVGLILVAPYVVGKLRSSQSTVPTSERVASELDVLIVGDGRRHAPPPQLPPTPTLAEFDVHYSVGYARGDGVRWTLVDGADADEALRLVAQGDAAPPVADPPVRRPEADSVLLLLADGSPPVNEDPAGVPELEGAADEVARWQRVAVSAVPAGTPTFALLQTTKRERLERWREFVTPGRAASIQALGSQTVADAAVRLAVEAPTAQADFALAMAHRPILLFDRAEPVPWPHSVNALFAEGRVTLCRDQGVAETECGDEPLKRASELENGGTHMQLRTKSPRELRHLAETALAAPEPETEVPPPGAGSTIYVHPVPLTRDGRELLYLDYWWYLPDNPVGVGGGALCGAGFVIPGVTCQNHQSDWEGITVVVDRSEAEPRVRAVHYAQHASVVKYGWTQLRERWEGDAKVRQLIAGIDDAGGRPLAFVAAGTHATYPLPCRGCQQVTHPDLGEAPHRGDFGWVGNQTEACGRSSCLQMLPTRAGGEEPALWNAYDGPWGERHCFLTYYCDSGSPPTAPGSQERYEHPNRYDGFVDGRWRFRREAFED